MSAVNPYTPPRAQVSDVADAVTEYQELKFWSAKGRIGRVRYLGEVMAASAIGIFALGLLAAILLPMLGMGALALLGLGYVALMLFGLLALIQRSHDMGWSGWTVLLAIFIPFVGLIWLFKPGTPGPNAYGPPPPPNSTGVIVAAWLTLGLPFIIGMLAAIALPAYQGYVKRAQAMQQQAQQQAAQQQQQ